MLLCAFVCLSTVMHGGSIRLPLSLCHCCRALSFSCVLQLLGWQDNYIPGQTGRKTGSAQKFRSRLPSHCWCRLQDQAPDLISTLPLLPAWLWNADDWKPEGKADSMQPRETDIRATLCQKQLHILFGILGVLVTQSSLGVNFCIILGALHLPIMNKRNEQNKIPQEWKTSRKENLLIAFRRTYFSKPSPPLALEEAYCSTKQSITSKELFSFDQINSTIWSPGNQKKKKKKNCFYAFATCYISFKM